MTVVAAIKEAAGPVSVATSSHHEAHAPLAEVDAMIAEKQALLAKAGLLRSGCVNCNLRILPTLRDLDWCCHHRLQVSVIFNPAIW